MSTKKFCNKCGKELKDNARFCPYCGGEIIPNVQQNAAVSKTKPANKKLIVIISISVVAIAAGIIISVACCNGCKSNSSEKSLSEKLTAHKWKNGNISYVFLENGYYEQDDESSWNMDTTGTWKLDKNNNLIIIEQKEEHDYRREYTYSESEDWMTWHITDDDKLYIGIGIYHAAD